MASSEQGTSGTYRRQRRALLHKALLSRKRRRVSTAVELLLPLVLALPLAGLRILGSDDTVPAKSGVDRAVRLGDPFATKYAARLCRSGAIFAVAPEGGLGREFRGFLRRRFGTLGAWPTGWPKLVPFPGRDEVDSYVRLEDYGAASRPALCGAISFDNDEGTQYTLRLNGTLAGNKAAVCGGVDTRRTTTGRAIDAMATSKDWYACSGFLSLQKLADEFLLSRSRGAGAATAEQRRQPWRLEVDMVPFPTPSYKSRATLSAAREVIMLTSVLFFAYVAGQVAGRVVVERELKLLEAMKLLGLEDRARFSAYAIEVLPVFALYGAEFGVALSLSVFTRSSPLLLVAFFVAAGSALACMSLAVSTAFDSAKAASLTVTVGTFLASRVSGDSLWGCLLPPVALTQGLNRIVELELKDVGLRPWNLPDKFGFAGSTGLVLAILAASVPLYLALWVYLERVVPHSYGAAPCPWYRPWEIAEADAGTTGNGSIARQRVAPGSARIVEGSLAVACTVEAKGIRKEFVVEGRRRSNTIVAVRSLDLGMTEGEIVALLGHNGAGKSTTVGMLTGVLRPTKGSVSVYGHDVARQPAEARRHLGVCPQYDVLFEDLTAAEHLQLAAALKGAGEGAEVAGQGLLHDVGLQGALGTLTPAGALSSGRRRALNVALAFVGDPKFIVLDEPTSGMDPFVRRAMWDLLKRCRSGRVTCLSTHYMEEAEMLGDQVCIMSAGAVQCYGSPDWLKVRLGSGYTLSLGRGSRHGSDAQLPMWRDKSEKQPDIGRAATERRHGSDAQLHMGRDKSEKQPDIGRAATDTSFEQRPARRSRIDAAEAEARSSLEQLLGSLPTDQLRRELSVVSCTATEASLRVPFQAARELPALLRCLDKEMHRFGFVSVTVSATTLEELFVRLADGEGGGAASKEPVPGKTSAEAGAPSRAPAAAGTMSQNTAASMDAIVQEMAQMQGAKEGKGLAARQAGALLLKRWQSIQRNKRSLLCVCLVPLLFNCLGIASIATSFELDSPPLELLSTAADLNPRLGDAEPRTVVPFTTVASSWELRQASRLIQAGVREGMWDQLDYLPTNRSLWCATAPRRWRDALQVEVVSDSGAESADADSTDRNDLSKYEEMREKGAPEFVIRKVMEKDGIPSAVVRQFLGGPQASAGGAGPGSNSSVRLSVVLQDMAQVSVDSASREAKLELKFGQAPLKADVTRSELQREELVACAIGDPGQAAQAEEAADKLEEDTQKALQEMQAGGAPPFAQRAYLEQAGVATEDIDILVASISAEAVPAELKGQLERCARWQAFAAALLESSGAQAASRYGAYFVEDAIPKSRRARLAIFYNASVFHSAPLFLAQLQRAGAVEGSVHAIAAGGGAVPELRVVNWPMPLTEWQRQTIYSTQGFSFFTMALIGAAFLPASMAADAASEVCAGIVRQQQIAGAPAAVFVAAGCAADSLLVLPPLLTQLAFISMFQLAVFVDCLPVVAWLLALYALASVAQVYALIPGFKTPGAAQNAVLALNVGTGFIMALICWILSIPFLGETANNLGRIVKVIGRVSPAFNLVNSMFTLPGTALPGFSTVHGMDPLDWEVCGQPLLALVANLIGYTAMALWRGRGLAPSFLPLEAAGAAGASDSRQAEDAPAEVQEELELAQRALEGFEDAEAEEPVGQALVLLGLSVAFPARSSRAPKRSEQTAHGAGARPRDSALGPLSLVVPQGTVLGLLGVSGSGKSVTLAALAGSLLPSACIRGEARLNGRPLLGRRRYRQVGEVGFCPQSNQLSPGLTVNEQLRLFGRLRGLRGAALEEEARWLVQALELEAFDESRGVNLSGGNQRKLHIACALVGSPQLLCLDEPSAGLDPVARRALWRTVNERLQTSSAAVVATKSMDEAEALCTKLAILGRDGRLRTIGTAADLRSRYGGGRELRVSLQRPTMAEVLQAIVERSDARALASFMRSCAETLGGTVASEEELRHAAERALRQPATSVTTHRLVGQLGDASWVRGLRQDPDVEAGSRELLPEDSEEMSAELARRSQKILGELQSLFPDVQCVEAVSLTRAFSLHDSPPGDDRSDDSSPAAADAASARSLADIFERIEERKQSLQIADYSISQVSLEHVFNRFALDSGQGDEGVVQ